MPPCPAVRGQPASPEVGASLGWECPHAAVTAEGQGLGGGPEGQQGHCCVPITATALGDPHHGQTDTDFWPCGPGAERRQRPPPHAVFPACPHGWSSRGFGELGACSHESGVVMQWAGRVRDCGDITHTCAPRQSGSTGATGATIPVTLLCPAAAGGLDVGWETGLEVAQWGWRGLQGSDKDFSG